MKKICINLSFLVMKPFNLVFLSLELDLKVDQILEREKTGFSTEKRRVEKRTKIYLYFEAESLTLYLLFSLPLLILFNPTPFYFTLTRGAKFV